MRVGVLMWLAGCATTGSLQEVREEPALVPVVDAVPAEGDWRLEGDVTGSSLAGREPALEEARRDAARQGCAAVVPRETVEHRVGPHRTVTVVRGRCVRGEGGLVARPSRHDRPSGPAPRRAPSPPTSIDTPARL